MDFVDRFYYQDTKSFNVSNGIDEDFEDRCCLAVEEFEKKYKICKFFAISAVLITHGLILLVDFYSILTCRKFLDSNFWSKTFLTFFLFFLPFATFCFYLKVSFGNPGFVENFDEFDLERKHTPPNETLQNSKNDLRECFKCKLTVPLRAKHCKICNKCVRLHDHHCPWIGNCVGEKNRVFFYFFLFFQFWELFFFLVLQIFYLLKSFDVSNFDFLNGYQNLIVLTLCVLFSIIFKIAFLISVFSILYFHTFLAVQNLTTWEFISWKKISYLQNLKIKNGSPFSRGLRENLKIYFLPPPPTCNSFVFYKTKRVLEFLERKLFKYSPLKNGEERMSSFKHDQKGFVAWETGPQQNVFSESRPLKIFFFWFICCD